MTVRIVCDSTADLDDEFRDAHRIEVVPLQVIIGDQSYRDGIDITPAELYSRMRRDGVSARTSQPTPAEFEAVFRGITDAGDSVMCTTISSGLSGTYGSAGQAAEALPGRPIRVIDTRSVSVGHYALLKEAVRVADAGGDLDAVAAAVDTLLPQIRLLFTVETLEYLRRGGRIGGARALLGSMLDVKPILAMEDGSIEPVGRVRTYRRAVDSCTESVERAAREWGGASVFIAQADAAEAAAQMTARLAEALPGTPVTLLVVGPVIGAHAGPGAVGVAFHRPAG
ncbi:MAG: DegV family protein [Candidatus Dormibacteraeota bacterium]|nr:DegV family protein [Candidatus Dormibacteraeota bacterium]